MKNLGIFIGFLPLIALGLLAGGTQVSTLAALVVALLVSLLVGFDRLKRGFYLDWANIVLFGGALFCILILNMTWVADYLNMVVYAVFTVMASVSLLAGVPFTLQYARDMVDRSIWDHPVFKSTNVFMTGVWSVIFAINFVLVAYETFNGGPAGHIAGLASDACLIAGFVFSVWYPEYVQKKGRAAHGNTQ